MSATRNDGRRPDELRPITFEVDYLEQPHGSVLVIAGEDEGPLHGDGRRKRCRAGCATRAAAG